MSCKMIGVGTHCVCLHLIPFEEDYFIFLRFWSTHMRKGEERKEKWKSYDGLQRRPASQCSQFGPPGWKWTELVALDTWLSLKAI